MREQQGVRGPQRQAEISLAGSVLTHPVAEECGHPRLVDREPVLNSGAERGRDRLRVVAEPARGVAIGPAAAVLQRLRQIPVVEGGVGRDPGRVQLVDEAAVEIETLGVGTTAPGGKDARPGDGEAIAAEAELAHERDVLRVPMEVIAGDIARVAVGDRAGGMAEDVPDRLPAATLADGALDLIGRGGGAPHPVFGKDHCCR